MINKRVGDIVQGDKTGDDPLSEVVKQYLKEKYNKPGKVYLGVVHRLDRPTSGIVLFAKTSKALPRLNKMFAQGETKKIYWAVVKNIPPQESDTLTHWLVPNSKRAELDYKVIKKLDNYFLLEIDLKTGRHHQIRAQLAAIGCTIKGDLKYGADRSNKDGGIHLHARSLTIIHPVKKEPITFLAPPPEDPVWNACISE